MQRRLCRHFQQQQNLPSTQKLAGQKLLPFFQSQFEEAMPILGR